MSNLSTTIPSTQSTKRIYALLVGIDEYPAAVSPLRGCVNDVTALEDYLKEWIDPTGDRLHLKTLTNQQATKQNIIAGFRQHLGQAGEDDVILFAYSGHGSQETAHPAFWHLEPDRLNETLVCYDSRLPGHWDLADKELNQLIAEVGNRCPHVVVILDCCHSGSGLRETATVRRAVTDRRDRPLDSYLFSSALSQAGSTAETSPSGWHLSAAPYILLAACRDSETAKEYTIDGQPRGAFSYFLLNTLKQANGSLSYRDLFKRASALVESKVKTQSPQLEAANQAFLTQQFLGGGITSRPFYFTLKQDQTKGWIIDGGAIHRIPPPTPQETTTLAIFPFNSSFQQLRSPDHAIATAHVTQVFPNCSQIACKTGALPDGDVFKAVVTHLPLPRIGVYVEGDVEATQLIHQALQHSVSSQSLYVDRVAHRVEAKLRVLASHGRYLITSADGDRPLTTAIQAYTPASAGQVVTHLEHVSRWMNTIELAPPTTSQIPPDAIHMQLFDQAGQEIHTPRFAYQLNSKGEWIETPFKLKLTNTSRQKLYCTVLSLSEQYAIDVLFEAGGVWLEPDQEAWALAGNWLYPQVPREWWQRDGITETQDVLKLIVSTAEFDARLLLQDDLDPFHPDKDLSHRGIQNGPTRGDLQGTLNHLMNCIQWRRVGTRAENTLIDDWTTSQIDVTTLRPQDAKSLSVQEEEPDRTPKVVGRGESTEDKSADEEIDRTPKVVGRGEPDMVSLGFGVTIHAHPQLRSQARLITVSQAADLGNCLYPLDWRDHPDTVELFQFTADRGSSPGLSLLELSQVAADCIKTVTTATPLKLTIDRQLAAHESLIPLAFDGETFVVLGRSTVTADGKTEVLLERLTHPLQQQQRCSEGVIRVLFQTQRNVGHG